MSFLLSGTLGSGGLGSFPLGADVDQAGPTQQTQSGVASIKNQVLRVQAGVAAIVHQTNQTQSGTARITATIKRTQGGHALIQGSATLRVTQLPTESLVEGPATANLRVTQVPTEALIEGATARAQNGVARITHTTVRTQAGKARITVTTTRTQSGVASLGVSSSHTQSGVTRISRVTPKIQIGVANIFGITNRPQSGVSSIKNQVPRVQAGVAAITSTFNLSASDTLTYTFTDASTITTGTDGSPASDDSNALTITETSSIVKTTVVPVTTGDTSSLSIAETSFIFPDGERVDHLTLACTETSSIVVSSIGGGTAPTATPPLIQLATPRAHNAFDTFGPASCQSALNAIKVALLSAGWTITASVAATAGLSIFTIPTRGPTPSPRVPVFDNYCNVDGFAFYFYDPRIDVTTGIPNVIWVIKGLSDGSPTGDAGAVVSSVANLAADITASTTFTATPNGPSTVINMVSKLTADAGNNHTVFGNGSECAGANSQYGGYEMTSQAANGISSITLRFTLGDEFTVMLGAVAQTVQLDLGMGDHGGTNDIRYSGGYHLGQFEYQIYADPYQVLITPMTPSDVPFHGGDIYVFNSSFFFSAPWVDPARSVTYCAYLLLDFPEVRQTLQTAGAAVQLNGNTYQPTPGGPQTYGSAMLVSNQPTEGLKTWNTDPTVYQDAVIMLSNGQHDYKAVGYLWNAYLTTDTPALGSTGFTLYGGTTYKNFVMSQNTIGSIATLFLITS